MEVYCHNPKCLAGLQKKEIYFTDASNDNSLQTRTELHHIIILPHTVNVLLLLSSITFPNSVPDMVSATLSTLLNTLHFSLIH
jgi:hypothetical protein